MSKLTLLRVEYAENRTRGVMLVDGVPVCVCVERPWNNNAQDDLSTENINEASCIPEQVYNVAKHKSPSKGWCFKIYDVPGRTDVLIHSANWANQLLGCVAPGLIFQTEISNNEPGVMQSKAALDLLWRMLPEKFEMRVTSWISE